MNIEQIAHELGAATTMELAALRETLERVWGVSAATRVANVLDDGKRPEPPKPPEPQTEFNLLLEDPGPNKINAIKVVREITGLGLKESKDLIESPMPKELAIGITRETADLWLTAFAAVGARAVAK